MSVHIDELHSEVVPSAPGPGGPAATTEPPWAAQERWCSDRDRAAWLAARVGAEGFDD